MIFDTLKVSRDLQEHFSREQAEALASTLNSAAIETLATKDDLRTLGAELRTEFSVELGKVRTDMADMRSELQRWMFGLVVAQFFALAGLMLALQKLGH